VGSTQIIVHNEKKVNFFLTNSKACCYIIGMKNKAPQSATNTLKGSNCAIAHTAHNNAIVSQLHEKGKAHHGVLQLQYPM
jgi:hypothetical protein